MYLIFDTAANGKPKSYKAPYDDIFNWPRLLHLSWIMLGQDLKPIIDYDYIIKPQGYQVTDEQLKAIHIEPEDIEKKGLDIKEALAQFKESVQSADYIFAHNLVLNESILGAEFYRASISNPLIAAEKYCLMHEGTYYCKLPGKRGYKWPSLQEMHTVIFKQGFTPSNNARADAIAAARCFIALKKARAFEDIFAED